MSGRDDLFEQRFGEFGDVFVTLRRILAEALLIAKLRSDLNKQVQAFFLSLFPSGIT